MQPFDKNLEIRHRNPLSGRLAGRAGKDNAPKASHTRIFGDVTSSSSVGKDDQPDVDHFGHPANHAGETGAEPESKKVDKTTKIWAFKIA